MIKLTIATALFLVVTCMMRNDCCENIEPPIIRNDSFYEELRRKVGGYLYGGFCTSPDHINMTVCYLHTPAGKSHISLAAHVAIYDEENFLRIGIYSSPRTMWTFFTINSTEYESYKSCMPR